MIINFEMSGGFAHIPALSRSVIIDTTQTDPQHANLLESLVRESNFFDQPAQAGTLTKGAADYRTYTITVEDGSRVHTIRFTEPITDASLASLVSQLQSLTRSSKP